MRGMTSLVAAVAVGLVSLAASAVKVEVVKVHSDAMGKDVPLSVILPDAYGKDSGRQFPVVYAQHSAFWLSHPELRRVPHSTRGSRPRSTTRIPRCARTSSGSSARRWSSMTWTA